MNDRNWHLDYYDEANGLLSLLWLIEIGELTAALDHLLAECQLDFWRERWRAKCATLLWLEG